MTLLYKKIRRILPFLALLGILVTCGKKEKAVVADDVNFTSYVNPFIGTAPLTDPKTIGYTPPKDWRVWAGLVYPGSSLPNAMVQLSPITQYGTGAGYEYEDKEILGFAHTNKGHWNLCNIPVLPISKNASFPYKSSFDHGREKASPGYYQVFLNDYGVDVKLSSTLRCGIHEYAFKDNSDRKILFDLGRANNHVDDWTLKKTGENQVAGYQKMGNEKIYFYATISQEIKQIEKINEGKAKGYALVHLNDDENKVILRIGLSFVSEENAKENLKNEIGNKTITEVQNSANEVWDDLLSKIKVSGGSKREKELFYTSLYRAFLWPALRSDINGDFTDESGKVRNEAYKYYTIPSLWDTYRNKVVLLGLLSPKVTNDVINSLVDRGEIRGFVPTFFHGDHAASFITGSYLRGINDFDVDKAYKLLLNNAYKEGGTRPYIAEYIEKGYIADPDVENPHVETKAKAGVSKTLEYAYDDYALSLLAQEMNDTVHYNDLQIRSKNYKNVFDASTNFMRGKLKNGSWITPFNPQYPYYEYMYREANAWQVSFYVPHDMQGLVTLYGGKDAFEAKLDSMFTLPWNPEHIARNVSSFIGQYCQGNQPDHEAPFAYYFVDKPEKSQKVLDNILNNFYGIGENGLALPGMDDAGEMSSWYVFTAMGIYPLSPADPEYLVTVPVFNEVDITLFNNKHLKINTNAGKRGLKEIKVDNQPTKGYFVPHDLFIKGGHINILTE
ncbi:GH92 family glycosyl hydrolase [Galbibacter pacificus]|uniref:GH92 family glycosyl hydrolase n=1 Tax=Galbibacter pacificus TaxID=2996052 RepID=A0ABT6FVG3_9FLAO|nr:GH92 family glycosyl hydrolase [Galbibacter pacificus]MDG3583852.1 GH92 family glycosyl hydrolase [Galbibacter pacificus]MDG3587230.1 GH92 family glycosyl hydrolase [Galbibacter pacificus]